jgi:LmbE family N-acetylglucosaminyl deacetylase
VLIVVISYKSVGERSVFNFPKLLNLNSQTGSFLLAIIKFMFDINQILKNKKILAVVAHPDDFEDYFGGTMLQLLEQKVIKGEDIHVVVATDGSNGGRDKYFNPQELKQLRQQEQQSAIAHMGIPTNHLQMWDFIDGSLNAHDPRLLEAIVKAIRNTKPDILLTHNYQEILVDLPNGTYFIHRDHRELAQATLDAMYPFSRDQLFFPQHITDGLNPHTATEILIAETSTPNVQVDITKQLEAKVKLVQLHASQFEEAAKIKQYYLNLHSREDGICEEFKYVKVFN